MESKSVNNEVKNPAGPQSFIFIGRSGCGKGTQAKLLIEALKKADPEHNVLYIQTGGELREFIKGKSVTQKIADDIFKHGGLIPEFLAVYFWANRIVVDYKVGDHLVCDGMPRKYHEAQVLDSVFEYFNIPRPYIVYLNVSEEWARERLTERHRADDNRKEIDKRLGWFTTDVLPTVEFYKNNPKYHFLDVNAERSIEVISKEILGVIEK